MYRVTVNDGNDGRGGRKKAGSFTAVQAVQYSKFARVRACVFLFIMNSRLPRRLTNYKNMCIVRHTSHQRGPLFAQDHEMAEANSVDAYVMGDTL